MLGRLLAGLRGLPWQNLNVLRSNRWWRKFAVAVRVNRQHAEDKRETEEEEEEEECELNAALRAYGEKVKAAAEVGPRIDPELPESLKAAGTKLNLSHNWQTTLQWRIHTRVTDSIHPVHVVINPARQPSGPAQRLPVAPQGPADCTVLMNYAEWLCGGGWMLCWRWKKKTGGQKMKEGRSKWLEWQ